jgi:hypothetical protein
VFVIQVFGVAAALNQIAFNWSAFLRALGRTRPIAVASYVLLVATGVFTIPLLIVGGIDGYAIGVVLAGLALIAARLAYLSRLFSLGAILRNTVRGMRRQSAFGTAGGRRAAWVRYPERRTTVLILTSDDAADARGMAERIADRLFGR